jgi:hypothetical protein
MGEEQIAAPSGEASGSKNNNDEERKPYRGRRQHRNRTNKKWKESGNVPIHVPKEKFVGRSEDLKGFTYCVVNTKGGAAYTRTTKEIARHVGEKCTTTGSYIRTAILTLNVPAPTRPTSPPATGTPLQVDHVNQEIFREKIQMYVKTEVGIEAAMKSVYEGRCSESIRSRLRGHDDYNICSANADSIALLKGIRAEMTGFRNKMCLPHALHKTMADFYSLAQGKHHNNQEYLDEFNSMVITPKESGATIGTHPGGVTEALNSAAVNADNPTDAERDAAIKSTTDRYLAVAFLLGADRFRYGTLVEEIENEYLQNKGRSSSASTYPTTVAEAYDYLCNYKKDPNNLSRLLGQNPGNDLSTGVAFTQERQCAPEESGKRYQK